MENVRRTAFRLGSAELWIFRCEAERLDPRRQSVSCPRIWFRLESLSKFLSIVGINFGLISD